VAKLVREVLAAQPTGGVDPNEELLTTEEAAALTKMSVKWFERKRYERQGGPPFRRQGRTIRYLKSELMTWWIEQGRVDRH